MRIFRYRVLVTPEKAIQLNPHHAPVIYALLAAAYGEATKSTAVVPDGVLIEAPEQARVLVRAGDPLAFGWTIFSVDDRDAQLRCQRLLDGLRSIGARARHATKPLAGGFEVISVEDAIFGRTLKRNEFARGIEVLSSQADVPAICAKVVNASSAPTLESSCRVRLTTPLRMQRPASSRCDGHGFVDANWFSPSRWLSALLRRLRESGFDALCPHITTIAINEDENVLPASDSTGPFSPSHAGRQLT